MRQCEGNLKEVNGTPYSVDRRHRGYLDSYPTSKIGLGTGGCGYENGPINKPQVP